MSTRSRAFRNRETGTLIQITPFAEHYIGSDNLPGFCKVLDNIMTSVGATIATVRKSGPYIVVHMTPPTGRTFVMKARIETIPKFKDVAA